MGSGQALVVNFFSRGGNFSLDNAQFVVYTMHMVRWKVVRGAVKNKFAKSYRKFSKSSQ